MDSWPHRRSDRGPGHSEQHTRCTCLNGDQTEHTNHLCGPELIDSHLGCGTRKGPLCPNRCHTKGRMGACGRAHPSFGGHAHPSFDMTQDIRDLFA